ncbi:hypothetical protein BT67DRAFT_432735 [Trichocladium antarcticum]|uniref:PD-(D/E)XK nuclease-like domain-containing protein n=1 Tax=Trichocladium antarcticum TaxID=1450529 RepID=A0AAN6USE4_9PEZI|nr:hypothetical protein BT67DRAFT_432735 [Trichocladium antarcticum]
MPNDSTIYLWLSGLPDGQRGTKRPRELDMATPSRSSFQTGRSLSPSKKRKIDEDGDEDNGGSISRSDNDRIVGQDFDATPRSGPPSRRPPLSIRPASFYPSSSTGLGHSCATSLISDRQSSKGSRRSASPVKTITGLQRLDKPVLYRSLDDGDAGFRQLPEDVRQLYDNILAVTTYRTGIYPAEIRTQIESLFTRHPPPDSIYQEPKDETDHNRGRLARETEKEEDFFFDYLPLSSLFADRLEAAPLQARLALAEFYKIRAIEGVARECLDLRRSEAAWNADVHGPLLKLALSRQHGSVICENATSARILPCFRPSLVTGEVSEGKMVDFILAPRLSSELDSAIQNRLIELSRQMKSPALASAQLYLNQTDYTPLTRSPSAVSIETKVAGASLEEGRLQLGIWTAAWYKRMEMLSVGGGIQGPQLPTLPLILVHDHQWSLYFAVDRLDRIEICGALQIGMTDNLPNIYQLLTVLRSLGTWIDTTFRSWATDTFGPQT